MLVKGGVKLVEGETRQVGAKVSTSHNSETQVSRMVARAISPALGRQGQIGLSEFEASRGYTEKACLTETDMQVL